MKVVPYIKHLIECSCVLPQYKNIEPPFWHQFVVFSELNKQTGEVIPSFSQCNNCNAIHKVIEINISHIIKSFQDFKSLPSIDDIKLSLPEKLLPILEKNQCSLATYQEVQYIIENELWGMPIILTREQVDGTITGKYLQLIGISLWKIINFMEEHSDTINIKG